MTARVRIELTSSVRCDSGEWRGTEEARIWVSDEAGNINGTRKPAATLLSQSRPELLERVATWMRQNADDGLARLTEMYAAMREPG